MLKINQNLLYESGLEARAEVEKMREQAMNVE